MKLHSVEIKNFRAIEIGKFDFTDHLSIPRTVTLIVGPNGSGKTSILDAIDTVVETLEDPLNPQLREGLEYSVESMVRGRGNIAEIKFECSLEKIEAEAINRVYNVLNLSEPFSLDKKQQPPLNTPSVTKWTYPTLNKSEKKPFSVSTSPNISAKVIGARGKAKQAVSFNLIEKSIFDRIGGVCYLDQRRSFRLSKNFLTEKDANKYPQDDVLSWLHHYYIRHQTWNEEKYGDSYWSKIKKYFNIVCYPSELVGIESGPDIDTLIIKKNGVTYDLYQMSSGEHEILRVLVGLITRTAINSIVLIDEIELHLHPAWQRKLIQVLREDISNNQYIFTTHSPFVKQLFFHDEIIDLGDLGEK